MLQFSPTLLSILGHVGTFLHVLHLDYSPITLTVESAIPTHSIPRDAYPPHGTYIATAHHGESTVAIMNLCSQNPSPSQFIDTGFEISEIVLISSVLLVKGPDAVVVWLLAEDGAVDGSFDNRKANRNDSLWEISSRDASSRSENPSFWTRLLQREQDNVNLRSRRTSGTTRGDPILVGVRAREVNAQERTIVKRPCFSI